MILTVKGADLAGVQVGVIGAELGTFSTLRKADFLLLLHLSKVQTWLEARLQRFEQSLGEFPRHTYCLFWLLLLHLSNVQTWLESRQE